MINMTSGYLTQGCHCQGKVREKQKFFRVREKSGKILDIVKVSEKSGNSVFQFIVHKFSSTLWNAFSFRKDEKYAVKQAQQSIWHFTPDIHLYVVVVVSGFILNAFFQIPSSSYAKSRKRLKMKRKILTACKISESKCKHWLFFINKRSVKSRGKVKEFLTFWWVATLLLRWPTRI